MHPVEVYPCALQVLSVLRALSGHAAVGVAAADRGGALMLLSILSKCPRLPVLDLHPAFTPYSASVSML